MTGKAGEYAVAGQLMLREVPVYFPAADYGVDLIAGDRFCRVQVKCAHISMTEKMVNMHGSGAYVFPLPKKRRLAISDSRSVLVDRPRMSSICDVVVFWGIGQNRFWIVPSSLCDDVTGIVLGRSVEAHRCVASIEELREMVSLGYTHEEISKKYGVHRCRITAILNHPETLAEGPTAVSLIRNCENRWDTILEFGVLQAQGEPLEALKET